MAIIEHSGIGFEVIVFLADLVFYRKKSSLTGILAILTLFDLYKGKHR